MRTIEIFSSLDCPYAYLAVYRARQVWPEYAGQVQLAWRALPLEYINRCSVSRPLFDAELTLFAQLAPELPFHSWRLAEWDWPATMWPAFEALACAQAQNEAAALEMSWRLRRAFFAEGRNIALRHELLAIAEEAAAATPLDAGRLKQDWDDGRYKAAIIADARRGWRELQVNGSATFLLPDGRQITNPAIGEVDFDEANNRLRSFKPYQSDPLAAYRELFGSW